MNPKIALLLTVLIVLFVAHLVYTMSSTIMRILIMPISTILLTAILLILFGSFLYGKLKKL